MHLQEKNNSTPSRSFQFQIGFSELGIFMFVCAGLFFSFYSLYRQTKKFKNVAQSQVFNSQVQIQKHTALRMPASTESGLKLNISCEKNPGLTFQNINCKK